MDYQKHIEKYKSDQLKAWQKLASKIQPGLDKFCKRWGLGFCAGMGVWYLLIKNKILSNYHENVSLSVMSFLDPQLAEALTTCVDDHDLGVFLESVEISQDEYEWVFVVIKTNEDNEVKTITVLSQCDNFLLTESEENFECIELTRQLADFFVQVYKDDQESAIKFLYYLGSYGIGC